jgi:hypothetical protein
MTVASMTAAQMAMAQMLAMTQMRS